VTSYQKKYGKKKKYIRIISRSEHPLERVKRWMGVLKRWNERGVALNVLNDEKEWALKGKDNLIPFFSLSVWTEFNYLSRVCLSSQKIVALHSGYYILQGIKYKLSITTLFLQKNAYTWMCRRWRMHPLHITFTERTTEKLDGRNQHTYKL